MLNLIKINILKEIWELKNNKGKIFLSLFINSIVFIYLYRTLMDNSDFLGINFQHLFIFYLLFVILISSFSFTSNIVYLEANNGTINHFLLSHNKLVTFVIIRSLIHCFKTTATVFIMLVFIVILLKININLASLIGVTFTGLIGIAFSSLSLVFKDIKAIISLFKVGFIYLLFKQNENIFIPFSYAKGLIWDIILNEYKISDFPISSLSIVFLNSLVYFIIGLIMFNYFEKIAMKKGIQS